MELLEKSVSAPSLSDADRAERLLEYLVQRSEPIGKEIVLLRHDILTEDGARALAWSESTTIDELKFLCDDLTPKGWIRRPNRPNGGPYSIIVTEQGQNSKSNEAFVAMWFAEEMDAVFKCGIRPGIKDAGYRAVRIDEQPEVDKIDDAILAKIRQCRFVVADFTHGKAGVRGSVYYEAGFARGLGIDVISTCRADQIDDLQFDTRQYYHIKWKRSELDRLRQQVAECIRARLGPGPGVAEGAPLLQGP